MVESWLPEEDHIWVMMQLCFSQSYDYVPLPHIKRTEKCKEMLNEEALKAEVFAKKSVVNKNVNEIKAKLKPPIFNK